MKLNYFKSISYALLFALLFLKGADAQSIGGVSVYSGITAFYNQDPNVAMNGNGQYGYLIGFDSRLNSGDMYFTFGGRYINTSLVPENSMSFFSNNEDYKLTEFRGGFGFNLVNFNRHARLRSKLLGSILMAMNSPSQKIEVEGYEVLNESWAGITTGLGLDYGPLTFDFEFQLGLVNVYKNQPESKVNVYTLTAGFFF